MSLLNINEPFCGYTIQHLIKTSALAETYRIADAGGKSLFLKLLKTSEHPQRLLTETGEPFEIAVCRGLNHPAVITFRDAGHLDIDSRRCDYLVTDYLQGELVAERLQRDGVLPADRAVEIITRILEGLDYLHNRRTSLVHNDITARNVMFDTAEDGSLHPHIIDMGHASTPRNGDVPFPTNDLEPLYRAPETFLGIYNEATDVFSAGALLFRMLFGRLPWECDLEGCDAAQIKHRIRAARREPLDIPADIPVPGTVADALRQALSPGSSTRFGSAAQFMQALRGDTETPRVRTAERPRPQGPDSDAARTDAAAPAEPVHSAVFAQGGNGFADVAGMASLKDYLRMKVINILRDKEKAERYRLSIPNGMLLYGPPGCGKTFLAEKFAEETGFSYTMVRSSDLASSYIHGSQQMIGSLFAEARKKAPTVLCFDEFDALVPNRKGLNNAGQSGEVNEFLSQLNNCGKQNVFVIATSNRPEMIDPAVLRTGRIDRLVYVPVPDLEARKGLFEINLKGRPCAGDIDLEELARRSEDFVASDIAYLVNDAATTAAFADVPIDRETLLAALACMRPSISQEVITEYETLRERMEQGAPKAERPRIGYKR